MPPKGGWPIASPRRVMSVTALPSASCAHPWGMSIPKAWAIETFPYDVVEEAMSITNGGSLPAGAANAIGFVPIHGYRPFIGIITRPPPEDIEKPSISCSRARRA